MAFYGDSGVNANNMNFDENKNYFRNGSYGNFFALVKLMAGENADLAEHLKRCQDGGSASSRGRGNKFTFLSNNFIDKVLLVIRQSIVKHIMDEIHRNGGEFGLEIDSTQDVAFQEQYSVVVRYINDKTEVAEHTVKFINVKDTTGKGVFESLQKSLHEIGLNFRNLVGYSFDGANSMRYTLNAFIKEINPKCMYTWCFSHRFNLVIKNASHRSTLVTTNLQLVEDTAKIFRGSHIKMDVWIDVAKSIPNYNSKRRLKLIGTTRWSSKQDAVNSIIETETNLYVVIKAILRILSLKNLEGGALIIAGHILNAWLNYENVIVTYVLHKIFHLLVPTTKNLQQNGLHVVQALQSVKEADKKLKYFEISLDKCFQDAEKFISNINELLKNDAEIASLKAECCIRFPAEDVKEEYLSKVKKEFLSFMEDLQTEMRERILSDIDKTDSIYQEMLDLEPRRAHAIFSNHQSVNLHQLCEKNGILNECDVSNELKALVSQFLRHQNRNNCESVLIDNNLVTNDVNDDSEDLLYMVIDEEKDVDETTANLRVMHTISMKSKKCFCFVCVLKYISANEFRKQEYENISKIYKYILMLPSTQVKCERDFSRLKLLKTRIRTSLNETSLESLMLISLESETFNRISLEDIIDDLIATSPKIALYVGL